MAMVESAKRQSKKNGKGKHTRKWNSYLRDCKIKGINPESFSKWVENQ